MKKILIALLISTSIFSLVSCGSSKKDSNSNSNTVNETVQSNNKDTASEKDTEKTKEETEDKKDTSTKTESNTNNSNSSNTEKAEEKTTITVYIPNATGDGLNEKSVTINHLTAYSIVNSLVDNKVVPSGTQALKFDMKNGIGYLDVSSKIYNSHSGSVGETLMLDALKHTFLKAFKIDKLQLTVEGSAYTGSHVDYGPGECL